MAEANAIALLAIARRDLQAAQGMIDTTTFHEAVWGFQVQQTIEKALKAWLYLYGVEPPFTPGPGRPAQAAATGRHQHRPPSPIETWRASQTSPCRSATTISLICNTSTAPAGTAGPKRWWPSSKRCFHPLSAGNTGFNAT